MSKRYVQIDGKEYFWANQWYDLETYSPVPHSIVNQINALFEEQERKQREDQIKQAQYEDEANQAFRRLKEKYQVAWYDEFSPISRLNRVLMEIDDGKILTEGDEHWLSDEGLFQALALYYERVGKLASAGSNWRKANRPDRTIEITEDERLHNNSAILTTRGGALRDLGALDEAERCGQTAIKLAPKDFYPYNLLGAVYFQRGDPEEGDKYFQVARSLGSRPYDEISNIRSAIEKAGADEKRRVIEYLLRKDPERYRWTRSYI